MAHGLSFQHVSAEAGKRAASVHLPGNNGGRWGRRNWLSLEGTPMAPFWELSQVVKRVETGLTVPSLLIGEGAIA